jgi:hypothetical protein
LTTAPLRARGKSKCRCAFSFDAATGEIVIAATALPPVPGKDVTSFFADAMKHAHSAIQIGAGPNGAQGGYITRLVGFPAFLGRDDLAKAVA